MKTPTHFIGCPGVLNTGMFFVVLLYSTVGFFGYWRYGEDTKASITLNPEQSDILAHLRPPILRAHGDNLEKRETIFRFEETLSRIRDTYRDGDIHGDRGYCHTKLGSVHFLGRRRMPVHPWLDVPVGDRTGHRVGSGKRIGRLLLETVEESGYHLVRRAGLSDRYLREHPRDSRRE